MVSAMLPGVECDDARGFGSVLMIEEQQLHEGRAARKHAECDAVLRDGCAGVDNCCRPPRYALRDEPFDFSSVGFTKAIAKTEAENLPLVHYVRKSLTTILPRYSPHWSKPRGPFVTTRTSLSLESPTGKARVTRMCSNSGSSVS